MVRVKICGITNLEDALAAAECGADALGFIFAPSPRRMSAEAVTEIVAMLPPFVCKVGVFVNSDLETVRQTMSYCHLDLAQLHGEESAEYCAALFPRAVKSFTIENMPSLEDLSRYRAVAFLLDKHKTSFSEQGGCAAGAVREPPSQESPKSEVFKGSKEEPLWQLARKVGNRGRVVLAGGLTPENVGRAIEVARPYAVDVSSGVEARPGKKDHAKLRAFIRAAKNIELGDSTSVVTR